MNTNELTINGKLITTLSLVEKKSVTGNHSIIMKSDDGELNEEYSIQEFSSLLTEIGKEVLEEKAPYLLSFIL